MSHFQGEGRDDERPVITLDDTRVNRRTLLGTSAGIGAGLAIGAFVGRGAIAQEATPTDKNATPEPQSESASESKGAEFPTATPLGDPIPPEFTAAETNWPAENYDLKSTRHVQGSSISSQNIDQLGQAWTLPVTVSAPYGALVSNPVIAGDTLFIQDAQSNVYAVNKETGEKVWTNTYDTAVPSGGPNGIGLGYGNAYFTLGGPAIVVAVKQDTGEELWRTPIQGLRHEGITMAPLVYDSTVYVSTIPGTPEAFYNGGQRGVIVALDASTGKVLWYFDTTTENLWGNARINSGGGLWHVPSVDDDGQLYVGTGNAAPYPGVEGFPAASSRPGDNDYTNSIIKINPDTAGIDWFVNVKPHDLFDLDNQLSPILTNISMNGVDTKVVFTSGKHGLVVAFNADTGSELWRTPVGKHQNDDLQELPEDGSTVEVFPGTLGGVETSIAYADGTVFAPVYNMASVYSGTKLDPTSIDITKATGQLVALDATTGEILWDVAQPTGTLAAATVVNDLVLTGGLDGVVRAYKVDDGTQVWTYQATAGLNAPFAISGDYLYIPAGGPLIASSDTSDPAPTPASQLIALKIGGEQSATPGASSSPAATPAS
ncbi:MAG TPA: PQQ-binding-like beta-propeller repeat protein [Thermomicrobiales bacterium]|nr:PQQ-binding-like beta-propeller repeat protein [Thermomicrobiales bacterium]